METLKKIWKKIVIILLVCFSLTTCMKNCTKSNIIRKNDKIIDSISNTIVIKNKIIDSLNYEIKALKIEKDIYKSTSENYKSSLDKVSTKRTTISVNIPKQEELKKE